jgi:hypothetical protein
MGDKNKKTKEPYYLVPMHIFDIAELNGDQKLLLAHIYSFGIKGCWQSNETLGKIFRTSARTISKWISKLKKSKLVYWVHPKGRYRTFWAKTHPDVASFDELLYMNEKISKKSVIEGHAEEILLRKKLPTTHEENSADTEKKPVVQPGRNLLHTNNTTNKDTIKETIERPSPLPAGGQSSAALEYRTQAQQEVIENFKRTFGISKKGKFTPLSEDEFQNEKQKQRKLILAYNK